MKDSPPERIICDSMLGGLARWLRALGCDALWVHGIEDGELIRYAKKSSLYLITSDTGIMKRGVVVSGELPALFIPAGLKRREQLEKTVQALGLKKRKPRCMRCSGELVRVEKEMNLEYIPPKTRRWIDEYYRCSGCNKLFWKGTHWKRIDAVFDTITTKENS